MTGSRGGCRTRKYGTFVKAIAGGALVTLLSFLLQAVNSVDSRIIAAYMVGFLLTLGPFDHVVVISLHVLSASSLEPQWCLRILSDACSS